MTPIELIERRLEAIDEILFAYLFGSRAGSAAQRRMSLRRLAAFVAAFATLAVVLPATAEDTSPLRVLFVGNSLTFYNDLPSIVEQLSRAAGVERPVEAERIARGGDSFYTHTERRDDGAPMKIIARDGWDVVVLQENGRVAAAGGVDSFPFASRLVRAARAAGATPIFYMTWAYRDRPETLPGIRDTYEKLSSRLEVPVAPVGEAWRLARDQAPGIELFAEDGIHPSPEGSYLAACVIFATLYERSPEDLPPVAIDPEVARRLRRIARNAVLSYE